MPIQSGHLPRSFAFAAALLLAPLAACSSDDDSAQIPLGNGDPSDVPIAGTPADWEVIFNRGDELFDLALREADGLGPLYTRVACSGCHADAARGPGIVQKMSVVEADGITPAADQSLLAFGHTVHPLMAAGATQPIVPPAESPGGHGRGAAPVRRGTRAASRRASRRCSAGA